jgi:hypothetical protein
MYRRVAFNAFMTVRCIQDGSIVQLQGEVSCLECDRCTWARFLSDWRVAIAHPESARTLHLITTRFYKCLMFSVCVVAECRYHQ